MPQGSKQKKIQPLRLFLFLLQPSKVFPWDVSVVALEPSYNAAFPSSPQLDLFKISKVDLRAILYFSIIKSVVVVVPFDAAWPLMDAAAAAASFVFFNNSE
jgi:hypothetical protein